MSNINLKGSADAPAKPPAPTPTWIPSRRVLAGGIGGVLSWALFAAISAWFHVDPSAYLQPYVTVVAGLVGINPAPSAQGGVAIAIGWLIAYFLPATYQEIARRINVAVISFATKDPNVPGVTIPAILQEAGHPPTPPVVPK